MLAHDTVDSRAAMHGCCLMQLRDVTETDDGFSDRWNTVDDTLQTISASGTKDDIYRRIMERFYDICQAVLIRSGKPSPTRACVRAFAYLISPRA